MVDGSSSGYLRTACDYVHLNPVRAKLLSAEDRLVSYRWSSFPLYLAAREHRPQWLRADRLLGEHGIPQDTPAGREEFERQMERRRLEEMNEPALEELRRGWSIGSEVFWRECLERREGKVGENHLGQTRCETAEAKGRPDCGRGTGALAVDGERFGHPAEEPSDKAGFSRPPASGDDAFG